MRHHRVIIIGGGPAGAACAWKLVEAGVDCLVIDKQDFPRSKICAGWITPQVLQDLHINPPDYPHSLTSFPSLIIYINGIPIIRPGRQYAIRRREWDDWLLKRSGVRIIKHEVKEIVKVEKGWRIDDQFSADILVGAGGTHCPVYRSLYKQSHPRTGEQIVALEEEFPIEWRDNKCRLWFFDHGLPGYAWYVPKAGGYLNIGVGGNASVLKKRGSSIQEHWGYLVEKLRDKGLVPDREFHPEGYVYYLRGTQDLVQDGNVFLIGDAFGLATLDMGEGIGPAVQSGLLAAEAILCEKEYSPAGIQRFSLLPKFLQWAVPQKT